MTQNSGINGHEMMTLKQQDLTERIIESAALVHRRLGPGCGDHTRSQASDRLLTSTTFLVSCLPRCVVPLHHSASHRPACEEAVAQQVSSQLGCTDVTGRALSGLSIDGTWCLERT